MIETSAPLKKTSTHHQASLTAEKNGEGRNRTGDTTIFSRGSGRAEANPDTTTETA
jgi:hypothetical protein